MRRISRTGIRREAGLSSVLLGSRTCGWRSGGQPVRGAVPCRWPVGAGGGARGGGGGARGGGAVRAVAVLPPRCAGERRPICVFQEHRMPRAAAGPLPARPAVRCPVGALWGWRGGWFF